MNVYTNGSVRVEGTGAVELAVLGGSAAQAWLIEPEDRARRYALAEQLLANVQAAAPKALELRPVVRRARLAAVQALIFQLKLFHRKLPQPSGANERGCSHAWLLAAEQSLEAITGADPLITVNFDGTVPRWTDLSNQEPLLDGEASSPDSWRVQIEQIALGDLDIALAPYQPSIALVDQLMGADDQGPPSWFEAFTLFLVWQFYAEPQLLRFYLGEDICTFATHGSPASRFANRLFERAHVLASRLAPWLDGEMLSVDGLSAPVLGCEVTYESDRLVCSMAELAACPYPPLASIAGRLLQSGVVHSVMVGILHQDAMTVHALNDAWQHKNDRRLTDAARLLTNGRIGDLQSQLEAVLASSEPDVRARSELLQWRADVSRLSGDYMGAIRQLSSLLETVGEQQGLNHVSVEARLSTALCHLAGTSGSEQYWNLAERMTTRVVHTTDGVTPTVLLEMARSLATLCLMAPAVKAVSALDDAQRALGTQVQALSEQPAEIAEVEGLRAEILLRLAEIDEPRKVRHLAAAEHAARTAVAAADVRSPRWIHADASAALGRALIALAEANGTDTQAEEAVSALEAALRGPISEVDPASAGRLQLRLGQAHWRLAKGETAKARLEAATIAFTRALRLHADRESRIKTGHALHEVLLLLATGRLAERRIRQAIAALDLVETYCPQGVPSDERGFTCMSRCVARTRLRALCHDDGVFASAIADADRAIENYAGINGPYRVYLAMRTKATLLIETGIELHQPELLLAGETLYAEITADPPKFRVGHRDAALAFIALAEAGVARAKIVSEVRAAAAAYDASRSAYLEALSLCKTHNFPLLRANCEKALKELGSMEPPARSGRSPVNVGRGQPAVAREPDDRENWRSATRTKAGV